MSNNPKHTLGRRTFLTLSSAPVLLPLHAKAGALAPWKTDARPETLSSSVTTLRVGYWPGSDGLPALRMLEPGSGGTEVMATFDHGGPLQLPLDPSLLSADRLASGDPSLAFRGAQVTLHGMLGVGDPGEGSAIASAALALELHCAGAEPETHVEWPVWSYQREPVRNVSAPLSFAAPLSNDCGFTLHARVTTLDDADAFDPARGATLTKEHHAAVRFTLADAPGRPRLRRGLYFLALPGADRVPLLGWRSYRWQAVDPDGGDGSAPVFRLTSSSRLPGRDGIHLLMSVDYEDPVGSA